jgi:hypothetical protein
MTGEREEQCSRMMGEKRRVHALGESAECLRRGKWRGKQKGNN